MNDDDQDILKTWADDGFLETGRIIAEDCNHDGWAWVRLSPDAMTAAHAERLRRSMRMWDNKQYTTTKEKRGE